MPSYGRRDWMQAELGNTPYGDPIAAPLSQRPPVSPTRPKDTPVTWKNGPPAIALALAFPWLVDTVFPRLLDLVLRLLHRA